MKEASKGLPFFSIPYKTKKEQGEPLWSSLLIIKTAATYSPTGVQYHRRWRA